MRIARYQIADSIVWGALNDDGSATRLAGSPFESLATTDTIDAADDIRLLAPAVAPRIFGVGLNYVSHIAESGAETPQRPLLFMKPATALIAHEEPIVYPSEGKHVDFEAELAVVIGRKARRLAKDEALSAVLGYTCANDVSERVIQAEEMSIGSLLICKGYDTFCPLGPVITTDLDPENLQLQGRVNGETRQSINTSDLLFSVSHLVWYMSQAITLLPGDVILTGTPHGVGPIKPGDEVEIELEGVGILRNSVVAEVT
jgi:2-keto-4-pentenoate hydratase/2-oxohepta-3-ene-1,7-dioic acid hydratase in catechol pathway